MIKKFFNINYIKLFFLYTKKFFSLLNMVKELNKKKKKFFLLIFEIN